MVSCLAPVEFTSESLGLSWQTHWRENVAYRPRRTCISSSWEKRLGRHFGGKLGHSSRQCWRACVWDCRGHSLTPVVKILPILLEIPVSVDLKSHGIPSDQQLLAGPDSAQVFFMSNPSSSDTQMRAPAPARYRLQMQQAAYQMLTNFS